MATQLVIDKIGKKFGDIWALQDVRARIHPGRITAFVGPNGAGKTTLFHVISGDYMPDVGQVFLNDQDITGRSPWQIARLGIGRQFQDVRVFNGLSVLDNVRVALLTPAEQSPWQFWRYLWNGGGNGGARTEEALKWLEYVGLQDQRKDLASELSFGQQKLLSLARLLAKGMTLLLLDEPTAGLSHKMIDKLITTLQTLVKKNGVTIVFIEHNMTVVASLADWIYFLNDGRVAFTGRADHVLGNQEVKETYMGLS